MGVKVVLATGVDEASAREIALATGILKKEHEKICGAVIEGSHLRRIVQGRDCGLGFDVTPEYLSVVYRARAEERATLIDFLSKFHPGRVGVQSPYSYGPEILKQAPIAIVGAVGSGDNDVNMMKKATIAFSTSTDHVSGDKAKQ